MALCSGSLVRTYIQNGFSALHTSVDALQPDAEDQRARTEARDARCGNAGRPINQAHQHRHNGHVRAGPASLSAGRTFPRLGGYGLPSIHAPDERLLKEVGEPLGRCDALVHVLQFLPDSQVAARHACDGGGNYGPYLGTFGRSGVE